MGYVKKLRNYIAIVTTGTGTQAQSTIYHYSSQSTKIRYLACLPTITAKAQRAEP